jgi:hypothetical protein
MWLGGIKAMKSKAMPQMRWKKIIVRLILMFALGLTCIYPLMSWYRNTLLSPGSPMMLYISVLLEIKTPYLLPWASWGSLLMILGSILFYARKLRKHIVRIIVFLCLVIGFLGGLLIPTMRITVKHLDSLQTDHHVYHLYSQVWESGGYFTLLECDSSGLICHSYGNPDKVSPTRFGCPERFYNDVSLEQNPITHDLLLSIGDKTYTLAPLGEFYLCWKSNGLSR